MFVRKLCFSAAAILTQVFFFCSSCLEKGLQFCFSAVALKKAALKKAALSKASLQKEWVEGVDIATSQSPM